LNDGEETMDSETEAAGNAADLFVEKCREAWALAEIKRYEREAAEKAARDALPEDEKNRMTALREQTELETERQRAETERERLMRGWLERGVTPRFYGATWENWESVTPEQKTALDTVRRAWTKNLFIVGGNGTGKTHLAMCLAKDGAAYCLMPELFRTVRENLNAEQETIDRYGTCGLLVLDEAGRQKGTDFERNLLFEIIDRRYNNMLPTTIMGNIGKREFADLYGLAVLDRLRPEVVEFAWGSRRGFNRGLNG
jgi:DNA replication protein DnaC